MKKSIPALALLISLSACTVDIPKTIIGYWEGETVKQDLSFSSDNRIQIIDHKHSTYTGSYTISEGNLLTCNMDQMLFRGPMVRRVEIKGNKLILTEKNRREVYHRRKPQ